MRRTQPFFSFSVFYQPFFCKAWSRVNPCVVGKGAATCPEASCAVKRHVSQRTVNNGEGESSPMVDVDSRQKATERRLHDELAEVTKQLEHAREIICELLKVVDRKQYAAQLSALEKNMMGGGGLFLTTTAAELEKALRTPGSRIVLVENHHYVLETSGPINISSTNVSIFGNNATIEGSISLTHNATLDACDVTFLGLKNVSDEYEVDGKAWNSTSMLPCIEVTQNSRVYLSNCRLVGGRDGLYLGIESEAQLRNVTISDCIRGIYEGVGCRAFFSGCMMAGNCFHLVLLGEDREAHVKALTAPNTSDGTTENSEILMRFFDTSDSGKTRTRADIAVDHNPITDVYAKCIHGGKKVELPEELATCGLSDPVY
ncbi:hypothetical protein MOQ_000018 [Trypanosoma cruzi marinkellei]|uniref:Right handed beta helix domain-containing protein n=1 Tax=Trypanosoma cruzi marinkellei TaxID=85056 RepID=K2MJX1_TRYCR|nr:hypothetical protein MOQ_008802 [Trypanosoma cruzi marinkellei]EKF39751.1 hypothetical protein MOQ_000018 [Trypanosoma cruzi marinkellei]